MDDHPPADSWPEDELADWEAPAVEELVKRFVRSRQWLRSEPDDLVQECLIHWWRKRRAYMPERGAAPRTFLDRVLGPFLIDIERRRTAAKRGSGDAPISLEEPVGEGMETLGDLQSAPAFGVTEAGATIPSAEDLIFETDEKPVLLRLNAVQRAIVEALKNEIPKSAIAASLQMSRAGLYREIERIKAVYRESGLLG